ncbi:type II secretion system F family protein [Neomoorella mulderi]|uniref:Bacterial type II secretion system protein F domain protein n=1 Tax=Moorella mulderi DSM 14980 TaxID=1122241 RepID=A0A151AVX3_9FIRM|nr:type II secretion system F family protein [Moorella mulderi]KYH31557.1 bacterial type II secretion system protein F domain protein [Moorella mulderi DSM 14980]
MLAFFFFVVLMAIFFFTAGVIAYYSRNPLAEIIAAHQRQQARQEKTKERNLLAELWHTDEDMLPVAVTAGMAGAFIAFAFGDPVLMAATALAAFIFAPRLYIKLKKRRRQSLFLAQLARVVDNLASAIRAGASPLQAVQYVAETSPEPIKGEMDRVRDDVNAGVPFEKAVKDMAARIDLLEAHVLADGLALLAEAGGGTDAVRLLEGAAEFVRERKRLKARIAAATGDVRLGFAIVTFIPVLLGLVMYLAMPEYRNVVVTYRGRLVALAGVGCLAAGHIMVARILKSGESML